MARKSLTEMEELQKAHRAQQRELQARIIQKKKNASKKTRKGINDECAELERQLRDRQGNELAAASSEARTNNDVSLSQETEGVTSDDEKLEKDLPKVNVMEQSETPHQAGKKPNRQKARLARRAAEQEAAVTQAAKEASNLPDRKAEERKAMEKELKARGLVEKEVRSDGHCLYAAIADQLQQHVTKARGEESVDYKAVRREAAMFIEDHSDDFAPFLEEPLEDYVSKIRDTGEWGGHLEMSALAKVYGLTINVLQGDGKVEKIESQGSSQDKDIWLAYYRHSFGLGEHYNSLRKAP